jgi:hypothetical protein
MPTLDEDFKQRLEAGQLKEVPSVRPTRSERGTPIVGRQRELLEVDEPEPKTPAPQPEVRSEQRQVAEPAPQPEVRSEQRQVAEPAPQPEVEPEIPPATPEKPKEPKAADVKDSFVQVDDGFIPRQDEPTEDEEDRGIAPTEEPYSQMSVAPDVEGGEAVSRQLKEQYYENTVAEMQSLVESLGGQMEVAPPRQPSPDDFGSFNDYQSAYLDWKYEDREFRRSQESSWTRRALSGPATNAIFEVPVVGTLARDGGIGFIAGWFRLAEGASGLVEMLLSDDSDKAVSEFFRTTQEELRRDQQEAIAESFSRGDGFNAIALTLSATAGDVFGSLRVFLQVGKALGLRRLAGGGTAPVSGFRELFTTPQGRAFMGQMMTNQAGRALFSFFYNYTATPGTTQERIKAGMLAMAYMMTPVASGMAGSNATARFADFVLNSIISLGYDPMDQRFTGLFEVGEDGKIRPGGQYGTALREAQEEADAMGQPDMFWALAASKMIPIFGMDVGYSFFTRSVRAEGSSAVAALQSVRPPASRMSPQLQRHYAELDRAAIASGLTKEFIDTRQPNEFFLSAIIRGDYDAHQVMSIFNSSSRFAGARKENRNAGSVESQNIDPGRLLPINPTREDIDAAVKAVTEGTRTMPDVPVQERITTLFSALPNKATAELAYAEFASNTATWPRLLSMYHQKVKSGEILRDPEQPRVGPTVEAARDLGAQPPPQPSRAIAVEGDVGNQRLVSLLDSGKEYGFKSFRVGAKELKQLPPTIRERLDQWTQEWKRGGSAKLYIRGKVSDSVVIHSDSTYTFIDSRTGTELSGRAAGDFVGKQGLMPGQMVRLPSGVIAIEEGYMSNGRPSFSMTYNPQDATGTSAQPLLQAPRAAAQAESERRGVQALKRQVEAQREAVEKAWDNYQRTPQAQKAEQLRLAKEQLEAEGATPRQIEQADARWRKAEERAIESPEYTRWMEANRRASEADRKAQEAEEKQPDRPRYRPATKSEVVKQLTETWKPDAKPWTPERIAQIEGMMPEAVSRAVSERFATEYPAYDFAKQNIDSIRETIERSNLMFVTDKPPQFSEGNAIMRSVNLGLETLTERGFDGFRLEQTLGEMVRAPKDGGVKGFGRSGAEVILASWRSQNPQEALQMLNEMRTARKLSPIMDVKGAAGSPTERYRLNDDERSTVFSAFSDSISPSIRNKIIDNIDRPVPTDPAVRDEYMAALNHFARQAQTASTRRERKNGEKYYYSIAERARAHGSMRYVFSAIAADSGNPRINEAYREFDRQDRRASYKASTRFEMMIQEAGTVKGDFKGFDKKPDWSLAHYVSSRPNLERAMATKMYYGDNPDGKVERGLVENANAVIANHRASLGPRAGEGLDRLIQGMRDEYAGPTATNMRFIMLEKFRAEWNKPYGGTREGQPGDTRQVTIGEMWSRAMAEGDKNTLEAIQRRVEKSLPWTGEDGGRQMRIEELVPFLQRWRQQGSGAVREQLRNETWGTRPNYWTSAFEREIDFTPIVRDISLEAPGQRSEPIRQMTEAQRREGDPGPSDKPVLSEFFRHMNKAQKVADTIEAGRELWRETDKARQEGHIPKWTLDGIERWQKAHFGQGMDTHPVIQALQKFDSVFWVFHALNLNRILWWSGRNMIDQGLPSGLILSQFQVGDVKDAYSRMIAEYRDPNSELAKWYDERFSSDISQRRTFFNEFMLQADPERRHEAAVSGHGAWGRLYANLTEFSRNAHTFSDNFNRKSAGGASFVITERYVDRYLSGELSYRDLVTGLKLNTLEPATRLELATLFNRGVEANEGKAGFREFMYALTEIKNENINGLYRISERSPVEQSPMMRQFVGLATYSRLRAEIIVRQGVLPMKRQFANIVEAISRDVPNRNLNDVDWQELQAGARVVWMQSLSATISGIVAETILGRRGPGFMYGISWQPWKPGTTLAYDMGEDIGSMGMFILSGGDVGSLSPDNIKRWFWYFAVLQGELGSIVESMNNIEARNTFEALKYAMGDQYAQAVDAGDQSMLDHARKTVFGASFNDEEWKELRELLVSNNFILRWGRNLREVSEVIDFD